ncbi:MAG: fibronectin type III domain-containing protein [Thermodesulfobacteriota bacterium]
MRRVNLSSCKRLAAFCGLFLLLVLPACGKKANPVVPVKYTPKGVETLGYQIKGKNLLVSWAIPRENTDGSPLTDLKGFYLSKGQWPTKDYCPTCPAQFQETLWIDPKGPEQPDIRIDADQVQLTFEDLKSGTTYFFQVKAVNKKETAGQSSKTLRLSWEAPFQPPTDLQVKQDPKGLVISWKPSSVLIDGTASETPAGYLLERKLEKGPWQRVGEPPLTTTTYTDGELQEKTAYAYRVKALRRVQDTLLESEASEEKNLVYTRLFPPPAVQDLVVFSGSRGVELRWQGIETMTIGGYHVYRRIKTEKAGKRITKEPIKGTLFEDRQVVPGTAYLYSVTALGVAPGVMEGPRSKEVEITVSP